MKQCRPWWLPYLLAAAVVLPIAAGVGLILHSVYTDDSWAAPGNGFAWLGVFMFTPVLVLVAALAYRAAARRDAESYWGVAGFFVVLAGLHTISLAEAAAVWLGFREGRLPAEGLTFVGGVWLYSVVMALGHWRLDRVFRPADGGPGEPGAAANVGRDSGPSEFNGSARGRRC